ncbi:MAG TPA: UDP-3-O-acyl-N-acetylglucosamine deacetylase [Polyangiaceae bacterium]|jgi:UDP-3-O-[3-hydroxymyristoyl] N-acetylglucosamine deacetylase
MTRQVILEGVGLHSGAPSRVVVSSASGRTTLAVGSRVAAICELEVVSTARATTVATRDGALRAETVEHALAALGGLGVHAGVSLHLEGPEMPLLDGGSSRWCDALAELRVHPSAPPLRVAREARISAGPSHYAFAPSENVEVAVELELDDPRIARHAAWTGDPEDFRARIAPARTFALAREVDELLRRGLVRHVDPHAVILIAPDAIHSSGRPFCSDEPARHKLLDLIGDLFLVGGPPLGRVRAFRPGHAANARAFRAACEDGILVPSAS